MTENERTALLYISEQMDASSHGICRAAFPARKVEMGNAGAALAVSLRRKGLVMRGHCQGTWRLTERGRKEAAIQKRFEILQHGAGYVLLDHESDERFSFVYGTRKAAEAAIQAYI